MAKRRAHITNHSTNTSKADLIRAVASEAARPIRPRDVIATLAERGIQASRAQVSQVLSAMGMRRRRRRRKGTAGRATSRSSSAGAMLQLEHLLAAKRLCDKVGGVEAAKTALDALAKLSG